MALVLGAMALGEPAIRGIGAYTQEAPPRASSSPSPAALTPAEERLLALAPAADLLALVDLRRVFGETLPVLGERKIGGLDALVGSLGAITLATGVAPTSAREAVLALSLQGLQAGGLLLVGGIDLDLAKLEPLLRANQMTFRRETRDGFDLLTLQTPVPPVTLGPLVLSTEELTVAPLGDQRLAIGNLPAVIDLVERLSKAAPATAPTPDSPLLGALRQTQAAALIRFGLRVPEGLREEIATQGDLFRSLSKVETIRGEIDLARSLELTLEARFPTPDPKEAAELNLGLKGLLNLARALFGSAGEPAAAGRTSVNQVLDQIRFTVQGSEVSLRLALPAAFLEGMSRPAPATSRP